MAKIIIGIHGLGNKPPASLLEGWWHRSITEGLTVWGHPRRRMDFELVYWANFLHQTPCDPNIHDPKSPLCIREPYTPGSKVLGSGGKEITGLSGTETGRRLRDQLNLRLKRVFTHQSSDIGLDGISDFVVRYFVKDLDAYYRSGCRGTFCELLAETLRKHRRKKILLAAHSMGSIIALDTLYNYVPEVKIHTLVTMGSPLGISLIKQRLVNPPGSISREKEGGKNGEVRDTIYPSPENITKAWYNLADFRDPVALDYRLNDDFLPNSRGVAPADKLVNNDYENAGERNYHKIYGYLRCSEAAGIFNSFLAPFGGLKF